MVQKDPWSLNAPPLSLNSAGPGYSWSYQISSASLSTQINGKLKDTAGTTVDLGLISGIEIVARDKDGEESHVRTLRLTGEKGTATVSASALRTVGLRVVMTRTDDRFVSLEERCDVGNVAGATVFVSIHNNAMDNDPAAQGTETFYWGTSTRGKLLAEAIQRNLVEALSSVDRGAKTHSKELYVLKYTVMPAVLE